MAKQIRKADPKAAITPKKSKAGKRSPKLSPKPEGHWNAAHTDKPMTQAEIDTVVQAVQGAAIHKTHAEIEALREIDVMPPLAKSAQQVLDEWYPKAKPKSEKVYCEGCKYLMNKIYIRYLTDDPLDNCLCTHPSNQRATYVDTPLEKKNYIECTKIKIANAKNDCALREELPIETPSETIAVPQPAPTLTLWQKITKMFQHNTKG